MITLNEMQITPEIAREWLDSPHANRNIKRNLVAQYTRDMQAGKWRINGETISISESGQLLDGQHRLVACIRSGVSFPALVIRGVPDETFDTINTGGPRRGSDILAIAGETNCCALAAVIDTLILLQRGLGKNVLMRRNSDNVITSHDRSNMLVMYPEIRDSIAFAGQYKFSKTTIALLHFLGMRVNPEKTRDFLEKIKSGANLDINSPALLAREKLVRVQERGSIHVRRIEELRSYKLALGLKALGDYIQDKSRTQLKWNPDVEKYPRLPGDAFCA